MDRGSMIRTLILFITLGNQLLVMSGHSPLPIDNAALEQSLSVVLTTAVSIWTWWKNNYISSKGLEQQRVLREKGLTK